MNRISKVHNDLNNLYVIAAIFNPAGFKSRYINYYNFERHIKDFGVNLVTIECIFGENSEFQVTKADNPFHFRVSAQDPLWVKENLINIAIKKLPSDWKYVLWLDADIEFIDFDWPKKILASFSKYDIIQVFRYANFLGPSNEVIVGHYSFLYALINDLPIDKPNYAKFYPHSGYGWGITRACYEQIGQLIDFGIVGSGDNHMAFCLIHRHLESLPLDHTLFHKNYIKSLHNWQENVKYLCDEKKLGYADVEINHFFHGFREDRQYVLRMNIITELQYDPVNDLYYNDQGVIQLKESRSDLKNLIRNYFFNRKEDKTMEETSNLQSIKIPFKSPKEVLENAILLKKMLEKNNYTKM